MYYFKHRDKKIIHMNFPLNSSVIEKKDNRKHLLIPKPYNSSWLPAGSHETMGVMKREIGLKNENSAEDPLIKDSYP